MLDRAERREPHDPAEMHSGSSKGPVKMWVCPEPGCGAHDFTYGEYVAPVCSGGVPWSFSTIAPYSDAGAVRP